MGGECKGVVSQSEAGGDDLADASLRAGSWACLTGAPEVTAPFQSVTVIFNDRGEPGAGSVTENYGPVPRPPRGSFN